MFYAWKSAKAADRAVDQANKVRLDELYETTGLVLSQDPRFLYDIYGLDRSIPEREAQNIAYLGMVIDGMHRYYGHAYDRNFRAMVEKMKVERTFLNVLLSKSENRRRWNTLRMLYYGESAREFVVAVDELATFEAMRTPAS